MLKITQKGDFTRTMRFLNNNRRIDVVKTLEKYGEDGVAALRDATPIDSGETAASWYYEIEIGDGSAKLNFCNSHINDGVPIAIILQYGHGTGTGGWVEGRDYINPSIQPVFDNIVNDAWKEVTKK